MDVLPPAPIIASSRQPAPVPGSSARPRGTGRAGPATPRLDSPLRPLLSTPGHLSREASASSCSFVQTQTGFLPILKLAPLQVLLHLCPPFTARLQKRTLCLTSSLLFSLESDSFEFLSPLLHQNCSCKGHQRSPMVTKKRSFSWFISSTGPVSHSIHLTLGLPCSAGSLKRSAGFLFLLPVFFARSFSSG